MRIIVMFCNKFFLKVHTANSASRQVQNAIIANNSYKVYYSVPQKSQYIG